MNNYDWLKTLSFDNMVKFLSDMCNHYDNTPCRYDVPTCDECWRIWLNAEGDPDDPSTAQKAPHIDKAEHPETCANLEVGDVMSTAEDVQMWYKCPGAEVVLTNTEPTQEGWRSLPNEPYGIVACIGTTALSRGISCTKLDAAKQEHNFVGIVQEAKDYLETTMRLHELYADLWAWLYMKLKETQYSAKCVIESAEAARWAAIMDDRDRLNEFIGGFIPGVTDAGETHNER